MALYYVKGVGFTPRCIGGDNSSYAEASGFIKSTLSDAFTTLDPERWGIYSPIAGATISINGSGQLVIPICTTANGTPAIESMNVYSLVSQTLSLDIIQHITGTNDEEYFMITDGVGKGYAFIYQAGGGSTLLCRIYGADGVTQLVTQYNAAAGLNVTKWRFRHTTAGGGNGTLFLETWNGATWDTRLSTILNWSVATFGCTIKTNRFGAQGTAADFIVDNLALTGESANVSIANDTKKHTKTTGGDAFNCGVYSVEYIESILPDQSVRSKLVGLGRRRISFGREVDLGPSSAGAFEIEINESGSILIYEFGVLVNTPGYSWGVGNEVRIQIVNVSGTYRVRYWWRQKSTSSEQQMYQSVVTSANIILQFPLHAKALLYTQGSVINNLSLEDNTGSNPGNILVVTNFLDYTKIKNQGDYPLLLTSAQIPAEIKIVNDYWMIDFPSSVQGVGKVLEANAIVPGIVKQISILTKGLSATKYAKFDVKLNTVTMLAGVIVIDSTHAIVDVTGLNIAVAVNDLIEVYCTDINTVLFNPVQVKLIIQE